MKIVLAGDSYSDVQDFRVHSKYKDWYKAPHYSWANEICMRFGAESYADWGSSQWDIWKQIQTVDWDFLIVNVTACSRFTKKIDYGVLDWVKQPTDEQRVQIQQKFKQKNKQLANKIAQLQNCYCWSPFPEFESWDGVDYIELRDWDELWYTPSNDYDSDRIEKRREIFPFITGNHFTQEGNDWMITHITQKIKERL